MSLVITSGGSREPLSSPHAAETLKPFGPLKVSILLKFHHVVHSLAFSVTLFCVEAAAAIFVMMLRRHPSIGGELGGPRIPKILTSAFLFFLWVFYVGMSTLEAYKIIPGMGTPPPKM